MLCWPPVIYRSVITSGDAQHGALRDTSWMRLENTFRDQSRLKFKKVTGSNGDIRKSPSGSHAEIRSRMRPAYRHNINNCLVIRYDSYPPTKAMTHTETVLKCGPASNLVLMGMIFSNRIFIPV